MTSTIRQPFQDVTLTVGGSGAPGGDGRLRDRPRLNLEPGIGADRALAALAQALTLIPGLAERDPLMTAYMQWRGASGFAELHQWRRLAEIGGLAICAVVHAEDPLFFRHRGFWWAEMRRQMGRAVATRSRIRGVSTLTQQLSRNLFLRPTRTARRKMVEGLLSVALEHHLPKRRILELYLNVVEWGEGTWGIEAAARHYFGHGCDVLTPFEAVFLATMLPAPRSDLTGSNLRRIVRVQRRLTSLLYGAGVITRTDAAITYQATARLERSRSTHATAGRVHEFAALATYGKTDWLRAPDALRGECGVVARSRFELLLRSDPFSALGVTHWPERWTSSDDADAALFGSCEPELLPRAAVTENRSPESNRGLAATGVASIDVTGTHWRVGLAVHDGGGHFTSVKAVSAHVRDALAHAWELLEYGGPPYRFGPPDDAARLVGASAHVLVGYPSMLYPLLRARHEQGNPAPCVIIVLGAFPRGGIGLRDIAPFLRESDMFVVNSSADHELTLKMFPRAQVRLVPLAVADVDRTREPDTERGRVRAELEIAPDSDVLLFVGRVSLEKNVHSLLRLFAAVEPLLRKPTLLVAGAVVTAPFIEMGAHPVDYGELLKKARGRLGLPPDRCCFLGHQTAPRVRSLMAAADVLVSLTLHHDENFGLAPIEGMACGLPAVGTAWGGLKDSIREGSTGVPIPTVMTPAGVKVDWAAAVRGVRQVLNAHWARPRLQATGTLLRNYAPSVVEEALRCVVREAVQGGGTAVPLEPSAFAVEFWEICARDGASHAVYRPGSRSFALYQELLTPYTSRQCGGRDDVLEVMILPVPVMLAHDGTLRIDDPLFPFRVAVPGPLRAAMVEVLSEAALQGYVSLASDAAASSPLRRRACEWALSAGIMIHTDSANLGALTGVRLDALTSPLFAYCDVLPVDSDVLVFGG